MRKKASEDASKIGIEVLDVRLKRVDLPQEVSDSVYRRMEAERKRVANELRSTGFLSFIRQKAILFVLASIPRTLCACGFTNLETIDIFDYLQ